MIEKKLSSDVPVLYSTEIKDSAVGEDGAVVVETVKIAKYRLFERKIFQLTRIAKEQLLNDDSFSVVLDVLENDGSRGFYVPVSEHEDYHKRTNVNTTANTVNTAGTVDTASAHYYDNKEFLVVWHSLGVDIVLAGTMRTFAYNENFEHVCSVDITEVEGLSELGKKKAFNLLDFSPLVIEKLQKEIEDEIDNFHTQTKNLLNDKEDINQLSLLEYHSSRVEFLSNRLSMFTKMLSEANNADTVDGSNADSIDIQ